MVGTLTYNDPSISTGLPLMSKKSQLEQWLHWLFQVTFHRSPVQQESLLKLLFASSAFLVLAASAITNFPESKVLAETAVSQNLEAASFFQQGVTRYNRQDLQGAEYAFRQALQLDPSLAAARNFLGNIFMQQNRLDVALQEYTEAIKANPNFSEAYYNLGLVLHQQGEKEAAIIAYRQSLVIDPTRAAALYNLGLALYEQGQLEDAIAAYQKAINLDSSNANAYFNLAIALQQQGQIEPAIASYRQALQLDPKNATAYNNMANLLAIHGQADEAISVYRQAIRLNPKNASAYYNLGVTLYNQGDIKKASRVLNYAHNKYREQGNIEQAEKIKQLMQQIAQKIGQQQPQPSQTATTNNLIQTLKRQMPNQPETPANPGNVPASIEFQPILTSPGQ